MSNTQWIRTECGKLINVNEYIKNINHTLEEDKYYDNTDTWNNYFENTYGIKKQGETLIDVLEVKDEVVTTNDRRVIISRIDLDGEFKGYIFANDNKVRFTVDNVAKIITHEQRSLLEQEVK